jgi:O-antigen/teichoic acid export membrane protein
LAGTKVRKQVVVARLLQQDRISTSVSLVLGLLLAQKLVAFVRGIVFARLLGTSEYGIYTLGFFLVLITVSVTSLGVPSSFGRYAPRYKAAGALRWFFRKAYVLNIVFSLAVGAVIFALPAFFSGLIYGDPSHRGVMMAVAVCVPGFVVLNNLIHTFSGLKLFRASSLSQFSQVVLFGIIGTVFVLLFASAAPALMAYAISIIISVALFLPLARGYLLQQEPEYNRLDEPGFYRRLLRFTIWFTVTPVLIQIFHYVDRLTLQRLLTSSDQGIYSAAVNLSATISAVGLAVNNVIFPHLSAAWEEGKRGEAVANLDLAIRFSAVSLVAIGFVLILLGRPIILLLLGEEYVAGAQVLPYLVVFYLFTISVWLFGVYASLVERTYVSTIGLVSALPVNIGLNLVLIPRLGIVGAGMATMLSYVLLWTVVVSICRAFGMPVRRGTILASLLPLLLLLPALAAACAIVAAIAVCLWTGWIVSEDERRRVFGELRAFAGRFKNRTP